MKLKHLTATIALVLAAAFPSLSQTPPAKYITARIYPIRTYGVWIVSPIQESKFKKNGAITELHFRLVGENDWKVFDINTIDRIEYQLSAQPEACVLPIPTQSTPNLSGTEWTYGSGARATVTLHGSSISVNTYDTGHGTPGPHYQITGTVAGTTITGFWKWIGTTSTFKGDRRFMDASCIGGQITADIATDGRSFRILDAGDPCGHGWKGLVFRR